MPGSVVAVAVSVGQRVEHGDLLLVVEAMKMEHRITAPAAGTVTEIDVRIGQAVDKGTELAVVEREQER